MNSQQVVPSAPVGEKNHHELAEGSTAAAPADDDTDVAESDGAARKQAAPPTVQFRAPRLGRPVPVKSEWGAKQVPKTPIASQFDDVGCFAQSSDVGLRPPELESTATKTAVGNDPALSALGAPPIAVATSPSEERQDSDLPADGIPLESLEPGESGSRADLPAADVGGPSESLAPLDSVPIDAGDETIGDTVVSDADPSVAQPAVKPLPPLTRQLVSLRSRVRSVLNGYYRKTLNSRDHDPWEVMHGMLAYGVKSRVRQGGPRGEMITSVGWLCYNKPCKGLTMMHVTREGELRAKYGVGLQGHLGQLLAMLAQCHVSADYPIRIGKNEFTIHDLIESEKKTCYPKSELTFKLLAFQYYLDLNETWLNDQGLEWDFSRLIREELAQPIRGAACGGTHRLSSLSLTVKARVRRGEPLDGEYAQAAEFVAKHHQYAFRLQNRDGSLSTAWFNGRGDDSDINRRIKTTGHILEWLCYSLSDEDLRDQRTIRAVTYLANLMYSNYNNEWEVGPMCHAIHALLLYDERVFQPYDHPSYAAPYRPKPTTADRAQPGARR
jgi:hypothetical protein